MKTVTNNQLERARGVKEFTKVQESWADHVLEKIDKQIEDREEELREKGWSVDDFPQDEKLMDLYDEEMFYIRYAEEMVKQREFVHNKFFGGS